MSFGICRVQKCGSAHAVAGLQIHNRRERERSGTNPDIRFADSKFNYYLKNAPDGSNLSFNAQIDNMLRERYTGKKAIRKDAVRLCDVIFTSDTAFFERLAPERHREFFEDCFKFAVKQYGEENIISAVVHMDEKTPHMHVDFVPLTSDGRLSAKSILGEKKGLQALQDAFYDTVCVKYGLERGERTDINSRDSDNKPRRHKSTGELKRETAYKAFEEASKAVTPIQSKKRIFNKRDEVSLPIAEIERMEAAVLGAKVAEQTAKTAEQAAIAERSRHESLSNDVQQKLQDLNTKAKELEKREKIADEKYWEYQWLVSREEEKNYQELKVKYDNLVERSVRYRDILNTLSNYVRAKENSYDDIEDFDYNDTREKVREFITNFYAAQSEKSKAVKEAVTPLQEKISSLEQEAQEKDKKISLLTEKLKEERDEKQQVKAELERIKPKERASRGFDR
jgi:hypothetical protein